VKKYEFRTDGCYCYKIHSELIIDGGGCAENKKSSPHVLDGPSDDESTSIMRREARVNVVCRVGKRRSNGVGVGITTRVSAWNWI